MALAGSLHQTPLLDILSGISAEQRDGCLTLTDGRLRAEIYFGRGQWLAAERVPVGPPLTEQFVEMGFMTPEQIEEVILVPFDEAAVLNDSQIIQALMADGLLTRDQLYFWALEDASTLFNAIASWPDGDFSFVDGVHPPQELAIVPLAIESIISATSPSRPAIPARQAAQSGGNLALRPETVLAFVDIPDTGQMVEISREEWEVLSQIDGINPLGTIAETLQLEAQQLVSVAHQLLNRGLLGLAAGAQRPHA